MNRSTRILNGKAISAQIRAELKIEAAAFTQKTGRKPGLATILVGDNPASHTYVANKIKACAETGMESIHHPLPASTSICHDSAPSGDLMILKMAVLLSLGLTLSWAGPLEELRRKAEAGDKTAQLDLGVKYELGKEIPQDYSEALFWYRKAADQGYDRAYYNIGSAYYNGQGVPRNDTEAARWFRMAADQGYAKAQSVLGYFYDTGRGVPQDFTEARKWYEMAASRGDSDAREALQKLHERDRPLQRLRRGVQRLTGPGSITNVIVGLVIIAGPFLLLLRWFVGMFSQKGRSENRWKDLSSWCYLACIVFLCGALLLAFGIANSGTHGMGGLAAIAILVTALPISLIGFCLLLVWKGWVFLKIKQNRLGVLSPEEHPFADKASHVSATRKPLVPLVTSLFLLFSAIGYYYWYSGSGHFKIENFRESPILLKGFDTPVGRKIEFELFHPSVKWDLPSHRGFSWARRNPYRPTKIRVLDPERTMGIFSSTPIDT